MLKVNDLNVNPYSSSEEANSNVAVVAVDRRFWRRSGAASIAIITFALLFGFVHRVSYEALEVVLASALWLVVCLPLSGFVYRWGIVGFLLGLLGCVILVPVAFMLGIFIAIALGIDVLPTPA